MKPEPHDTRSRLWWVPQHVGKIRVESEEDALFCDCHGTNFLAGGRRRILISRFRKNDFVGRERSRVLKACSQIFRSELGISAEQSFGTLPRRHFFK